jgi:hypothetical protein
MKKAFSRFLEGAIGFKLSKCQNVAPNVSNKNAAIFRPPYAIRMLCMGMGCGVAGVDGVV